MYYPDWLDRNEYPFAPHTLPLPMGNMHYVDEGEGEPIVMVHGNPTWSFLYRHLIKSLSPSFRCVAMDHIGFGLSDKPTNWHYRSRGHAENVAALIDTLGLQNITLIVQDWGGPTGLAYAIQRPENVQRLIILNTWLWPVNDDWYYIAFSRFMGGPIGRFLIWRFNFFVNSVMVQSYGDKRRLTAEVHKHYQRPLQTPAARKGCWVMPGQILGASNWLAELWNGRAALATKPTLIGWGMKDIAFREKELNRWTKALPQAEVVRLETIGHYVQEEGADKLGPVVAQFLDAH